MESVKIFVDPGIITTYNDSNSKEIIGNFIAFKSEVKKIEDILLDPGSQEKIIQIPFDEETFYKCLENPPATDQFHRDTFYKEIYSFLQKNIKFCRNDKNISKTLEIYLNPVLPKDLVESFNKFLYKCSKLRHKDIQCKCDIPEVAPIFISDKSRIKTSKYELLFDPDELKKKINTLNFYPKTNESLVEKEKKIRNLVALEFNKLGITNKIQFVFDKNFFENDFFEMDEDKVRIKILEILFHFIEKPSSTKYNREKYLFEKYKIKNRSYSIESCYLFRQIQIDGIKYTPRVLFLILNKRIIFVDIINRH